MTLASCKTIDGAGTPPAVPDQHVCAELWLSLASMLRSYTAAHGLHDGRHAHIDADHEKIVVRHQEKWLCLVRHGALVAWTRENGSSGSIEILETGRLRTEMSEEEMDLAAEAWARELMR